MFGTITLYHRLRSVSGEMTMAEYRKAAEPTIHELLVGGVMFGIVSHNEKWNNLTREEADIARGGLVKASEIRKRDIDPGDAYLRGLTDALTILRNSGMAMDVMIDTVELPITSNSDRR